jgi:hypothetical protein
MSSYTEKISIEYAQEKKEKRITPCHYKNIAKKDSKRRKDKQNDTR